MNWTLEGDKQQCKHGAFPEGEVCAACITELEEDETSADDRVIRELAGREASMRALAKKCHRVGNKLLEGTDRDITAAVKAIAEGTKLERLALEMFERRTNIERDRDLIRHDRQMAGLGASGASH